MEATLAVSKWSHIELVNRIHCFSSGNSHNSMEWSIIQWKATFLKPLCIRGQGVALIGIVSMAPCTFLQEYAIPDLNEVCATTALVQS